MVARVYNVLFSLFASVTSCAFAQQPTPAATPDALEQYIRQNFPNAPSPSVTPHDTREDARKNRDDAIHDAHVQFDADSSRNYPKWQYGTTADPMGRGDTKWAEVMSTNAAELGFPYGTQRATLRLQKAPAASKRTGAWLSIDRGQFLLERESTKLVVRFDDGKAEAYYAGELADHSTNVVGFYDAEFNKLLSRLRKAQRLRIEAAFFQHGSVVFEFDVHGFDPHW
jgi:hypothetical protein